MRLCISRRLEIGKQHSVSICLLASARGYSPNVCGRYDRGPVVSRGREYSREHRASVIPEFFGMGEVVQDEKTALEDFLGLGLLLDALLGSF